MASTRNYRKKWLRYHRGYEKRAYKTLIKTFRKWAMAIDFDNLTPVNYVSIIEQATNKEDLEKDLLTIYTQIGLTHGKRIGKDINSNLKFFTLETFESTFMNFIVDWLNANGGEKIRLIEQSFRQDIAHVITNGLQEGKDIQQIARDLRKFVNRPTFYNWQAQRIARTETTASANLSALQAGEVSGFKTNKVWLSAQDVRTRRKPNDAYDHLNMNEVQVGLYDWFYVPAKLGMSEKMFYPGDPKGSAGNVINCRCTVAVVPARDRNGQLIPI